MGCHEESADRRDVREDIGGSFDDGWHLAGRFGTKAASEFPVVGSGGRVGQVRSAESESGSSRIWSTYGRSKVLDDQGLLPDQEGAGMRVYMREHQRRKTISLLGEGSQGSAGARV